MSIILCTYNRAESLRRTLESCRGLIIPEGLTWDLLVVDNNSTDATKTVVEGFVDRLPLFYIFEPRQGKSAALNTAVAKAAGSLLLFTDDDVEVDNHWLAAVYAASQRHPGIDFFGGRVIPRWERPPPRWMQDHEQSLLSSLAVSYDLGSTEQVITEFKSSGPIHFFGANLALRKTVFGEQVRFREDIGPSGTSQVRGEETEFLMALTRRGSKGVYVPTAIVHHCNPPNRMTEKYVRQWFKGAGMCEVRLNPDTTGRVWLGAPRWHWRQLLISALKYACTRWSCPSHIWLRNEVVMAYTWGMICEFRGGRQAYFYVTSDPKRN